MLTSKISPTLMNWSRRISFWFRCDCPPRKYRFMCPQDIFPRYIGTVLFHCAHCSSDTHLTKMASWLLKKLRSERCMLFLALCRTKEMFDDTNSKLNCFYQS